MASVLFAALTGCLPAPSVPAPGPTELPHEARAAATAEVVPSASALSTVEPPREPRGAARFDVEVPHHQSAVVWAPQGASRHPLFVVTHGAGGTPEAPCDFWHGLLGDEVFILCLRGVTMDVYAPPDERGYFYSSHPALERELRAALDALDARFPDRVDRAGAVYEGFSQGATMGALALSVAPEPFTALVLVEGGTSEWTIDSARAFRRHGGARVVFACGSAVCADAARRSAGYLTRGGVDVRVVDASHVPGAGHKLAGPVGEGLARELPFICGWPRLR